MKQIFLLLISLFSLLFTNAQYDDNRFALQLVSKNSTAIGLTAHDIQNSIITNTYKITGTDITMVYLQQSYKGLPVYNQLKVLAFKNGKLVSNAGERITSIGKRSNSANAVPTISAENAVRIAMADKKIQSPSVLKGFSINADHKFDFGRAGITTENITAELMWVPLEDGKEVKLAWQVYLVPATSSDYWMIRVDAISNKIIGENNLTVYCNWDDHKDAGHETSCFNKNKSSKAGIPYFSFMGKSPTLVANANYRVVAYPAESPNHPGGAPSLKNNPWLMAPGNATSLGWHNNGTTDFTITRGNNVWSKEDRAGNNSTTGLPATSTTTPDPLNFDFTPSFTVAPTQTTPVQNQQFNITNLFYWNNIIHDITYLYGFDEVGGNFQTDNQGRGGLGGDHVLGDAQDGSGSNNANFSTPADGGSGRMQMFLWNGSPQKDGDVDASVVVHEFTHGVSNRLTGGPANAGCLGNAEQMGEGWSDYFALMATHDWANSTAGDGFSKPRGIGTYVLGQPITGVGIRQYRYCTNMAVNPLTYANLPTVVAPHGVGTIWCTVLWDMTWDIIQAAGINPNLYNPTGIGGNAIAMKLVTEGMRLQPCSPGFIDGRNAILKADTLFFGGQYSCIIKASFARRGLGKYASQGSSNSRNDQIVDYTIDGPSVILRQNVIQVPEGQNIIYTNKVTSGACAGTANFLLTDTLPSNVTYVSGGTYNAANRVVSFPVNVVQGATQDYSFTVNVNMGSYFPTVTSMNEQVTAATIPTGWTATSTTANIWSVSATQSQSAPNSLFTPDPIISSDQILRSVSVSLPASASVLSFWHKYDTEESWDGGVVEISTNGGVNWTDLGSRMSQNGYNSSIATNAGTPIAGRSAFTGSNGPAFKKTEVRLNSFTSQNAMFRWRFATDTNTGATGWFIDDVLIKSEPVVDMRTSMFNASGTRVAISDTVTLILQNAVCNNASIITDPANKTACTGSNTSFIVNAVGTTLSYQWQVSINGGGNYNDIPGANAATLQLNAVTLGMNNNLYRVIVSNACPSSVTSAGAILTVGDPATIITQPVSTAICAGNDVLFSATVTGSTLTYQWQLSTNGGGIFTDIPGATSATLLVPAVVVGMDGYQYRLVIRDICNVTGTTTSVATLTVNTPVDITGQPTSESACAGSSVSFTVAATGTSITYQWQVSINGGPFVNLTNTAPYSGVNTNTLNISTITALMNGYQYRVNVSGVPCGILNSEIVTLTANEHPVVVLTAASYSQVTPYIRTTLYTTVSPPGIYTYQWFRDGILVPALTADRFSVTVDDLGRYHVIVTDVNGCTGISNDAAISELISGVMFIYPNPNAGHFQVRYYSPDNNAVRTLNIFDGKGARVYIRAYNITAPYTKMDVNMDNAESGVYLVELRDANGKRLATGKVVLQK